MYGLLVLVIVGLVSLLISRVATVALIVTGLSRESARFQARSALTGVGFTTGEAELVVNHPVRRRIVMMLMLLGSVGLATGVAGLLATFLNADASAKLTRTVLLIAALGGLYAASRSAVVDRKLSRLIARGLRRYTSLEGRDVGQLLRLAGDYAIEELAVSEGHWLAGRTLGEARLRDEGVVVLGIVRGDGHYLGVPGSSTRLLEGDVLLLYGADAVVERLDHRPAGLAGDRDHDDAVGQYAIRATAERVEDRRRCEDHEEPSGRARRRHRRRRRAGDRGQT